MNGDKLKNIIFNHFSLFLAIIGATWAAWSFFQTGFAKNDPVIQDLNGRVIRVETVIVEIPSMKQNIQETNRKIDNLIGQFDQLNRYLRTNQ